MSELKPFGGAGDPLVGDFKGARLVKTFRNMCNNIPKYDKILEQAEKDTGKDYSKFEENLARLVPDKKEYENILFYIQLRDTVEASWECRDCIVLYGDEYWKRRTGK